MHYLMRNRGRKKDVFYPQQQKQLQWPRVGQSETRDPGFHPGFQYWYQYLGFFCYFMRHSSRELDRNWIVWDLNVCPYEMPLLHFTC